MKCAKEILFLHNFPSEIISANREQKTHRREIRPPSRTATYKAFTNIFLHHHSITAISVKPRNPASPQHLLRTSS